MNPRWMAVARGDEPADLVLAGGRVLSVTDRGPVDVARFELVPLGVE